MIRILSVAAAAAATLSLTPAIGATQTARYYSATPVAAPAPGTLVTRTTVWRCTDGVCTAPRSNSRDTIMCELVVREVGELSAFRANGTEFDAAALAKCNERAR